MRLLPLSPLAYLIRNRDKSLPLIAVILLAVLLLSGIVSLMNSIPLSIRTTYSYSKLFLGVTPRGDPALTPEIIERIETESPVKVERLVECRAAGAQVNSIVGKWPFAVFGLKKRDMEYMLKRADAKLSQGRLPADGLPEAIVSEPVARNLNLAIGKVLIGPEMNERYSPKPVKVVGIVDSDYWLMLTSYRYVAENHFPPLDNVLAFAADDNAQRKLDAWAVTAFKGNRAQVFAYQELEKETNKMFEILYRILDVVIATLVLVISVMMGMLMNIYQGQRLIEFGLLQAIGYTRRFLLRRVILESVYVIVIGWIAGLILTILLLVVAKHFLMDPNAFALQLWDPVAVAYTAVVPVAIFFVAIRTVRQRFRHFDPVGVVERRLV